MDDDRELTRGLRALADDLDRRSRPVDPDVAMGGHAASPPRARAFLLAATAAAVVVAVASVVVVNATDDGRDVEVSTGPEPTTAPSTWLPDAHPEAGYSGVPFNDLPDAGVVVGDGDTMALLSFDGEELGVATGPAAAQLDSERQPLAALVRPGDLVELAGGDPAESPDGCEGATGRGGVRVALCGDGDRAAGRVVSVAPTGETTVLVDEPPESDGGQWRWAIPSDDGRTVLAQWSDGCETPGAWLVPLDGGTPRPVVETPEGGGAVAVGWSDDGRAVVHLGAGGCDGGPGEPGIHLVEPGSGRATLVYALEGDGATVRLWERRAYGNEAEDVVERAFRDLEIAACCGEPSHGGPGATTGAIWQGFSIPIFASPAGDPPFVPFDDTVIDSAPGEVAGVPVTEGEADLGAFVAFTCGGRVWTLGGAGAGDRAPPEVLASLAEALVPHLYCTVGERPGATGHG